MELALETAVSQVENISSVATGTISVLANSAPHYTVIPPTPAPPPAFRLVGTGTCLNAEGFGITRSSEWNEGTAGDPNGPCEEQCLSEVLCIGYMTENMARCAILLVNDAGGQGGVDGYDPSNTSHTCWQKVAAAGLHVVEFLYSAPYADTNLTAFRTGFLNAVRVAGFDDSALVVALREGSIVVSAAGPQALIQSLSGLDTSRLAVMGYVPIRLTSNEEEPMQLSSGDSGEDDMTTAAATIAVLAILAMFCCCLAMGLAALLMRRGGPEKRRLDKEEAAPLSDREAGVVMRFEEQAPDRRGREKRRMDEEQAAPLSDQERDVGIRFEEQPSDDVEPDLEADRTKDASEEEEPLGDQEFIVDVSKQTTGNGSGLGIEVLLGADGALRVKDVTDGAVPQWNKVLEDKKVRPGDSIVEINGVRGDAREMARVLQSEAPASLRLKVQRKDWGVEQNFEVDLSPCPGQSLGLSCLTERAALKVKHVKEGRVQSWNEGQCAKNQVRPGDRILKVNGRGGSPDELERGLQRHSRLRIRFKHQVVLENHGIFLKASSEEDVEPEPQVNAAAWDPTNSVQSRLPSARAVAPLGDPGASAIDSAGAPPTGTVCKRTGSPSARAMLQQKGYNKMPEDYASNKASPLPHRA
jgi:hypothetical protein